VDPLAYRVGDACRILGIGRTTLYAAIKRGEIKSQKVGRRTLIPAEALKLWLNSRPAPHAQRGSRSIPPSADRLGEH
jgi:excisionase family DNA binding protein